MLSAADRLADKDGNGFLDEAEVAGLVKNAMVLKQVLDVIDMDGNGQVGKTQLEV